MSLLLAPPPALRRWGRAVGLKALGVVFLVIVVALVALSVAVYLKAFTSTVPVVLRVANIGDQLTPPADVKLRGVDVGTVTAVHAAGLSGAVMDLALDPADVAAIPANVRARILPKTLFGEKFVDLVVPSRPAPPIAAHAVIAQDRSASALEAETVFDHLVPLLRAVRPARLNETLAAIASALAGQSGPLGRNLSAADSYFVRFNPHLGRLDADISGLADLAVSLDRATPALLAAAGNFSVNARTLVARQDQFAALLASATGFAGTATAVVNRNANWLIALAADSRPVLSTLSDYSSELPCLLGGLSAFEGRVNQVFGPGPELHITLQDVPDRGGYNNTPQDLPSYADAAGYGPGCYGLPYGNGTNFLYPGPPSANNPAGTSGVGPPRAAAAPLSGALTGVVGGPAEQRQIAAIVAAGTGTPPPVGSAGALADLMIGPMLRGAAVGLQ